MKRKIHYFSEKNVDLVWRSLYSINTEWRRPGGSGGHRRCSKSRKSCREIRWQKEWHLKRRRWLDTLQSIGTHLKVGLVSPKGLMTDLGTQAVGRVEKMQRSSRRKSVFSNPSIDLRGSKVWKEDNSRRWTQEYKWGHGTCRKSWKRQNFEYMLQLKKMKADSFNFMIMTLWSFDKGRDANIFKRG